MVVEACVFNLSQMGELANKANAAYTQAHTEIPWRYLYGLRNRIVHDYEGENLRLIWEIISDDLISLQAILQASCKNKRSALKRADFFVKGATPCLRPVLCSWHFAILKS